MWKSKKVFIRKFSLKVLYGSKGCRIQKGDKVAITNGKETFYKATVCGEGLIYDTEEIETKMQEPNTINKYRFV